MPRLVIWTFAWITAIMTALFTAGHLEAQAQQTPPVVATTPGQATPEQATTCQAATCQPATPQAPEPTSPLQIKIGDATITPVGFLDLTNTWRSTNVGTSLQTNFGSIPYSNTPQGHVTENNLTAANSRVGLRVDTKVKDWNVLGYWESDFVGGIGNAAFNTQASSNSLIFRIRLYWVDLRKKKFEFLAGQSWSMMTPNRKQISPIPADIFYGLVVDVNYLNGLTWGRIPGVRFIFHPSDKATMGVALENATPYFGGSGGGGIPVLPAALNIPNFTFQLDQNVVNGVTVPRVAPDVIGKIAFDPSSRVHFEFVGVVSEVRLFNPLTTDRFIQSGNGGSANGNFEIFKGFRLISNNFWSSGEGRYLFGVAPNFIVQANGKPSNIHSGSTIQGLEFTHKNTQLYAYYGGIYIKRNTAIDADGKTFIGYGFPGSPNSQNRTTQEGTAGLIQTLFRDGKYGALQFMFQYAYFFRNPWFLATGSPKNTHEDAVWFNIRYVLPGTAPTIKY